MPHSRRSQKYAIQTFSRLAKWTLNQYYEKMGDAEVAIRIASMPLHPRRTSHYFKAASVLKLEDMEVMLDDEWDTIQL